MVYTSPKKLFIVYHPIKNIHIGIEVSSSNYKITSFVDNKLSGSIIFEHNLTDREKLLVEEAYLSVEEYEELRTYNSFQNFFNEEYKLTDINDLDYEDD